MLVEKRECTSAISRGVPRVRQVREERLQLPRGQHALVGERAGGQRREVQAVLALGALAQAVRAAVELDARQPRDGSATTSWRNTGMDARAVGPTRSAVTTTSRQARTSRLLFRCDRLDRGDGGALLGLVDRQESHADRVVPASGSSASTTSRRNASGMCVRIPAPSPLSSSAPTAPRWSRLSSAVVPGVDDVPAGRATQRGDERETARVVLGGRVVQPCGNGARSTQGSPASSTSAPSSRPRGSGNSTNKGGTRDVVGPDVATIQRGPRTARIVRAEKRFRLPAGQQVGRSRSPRRPARSGLPAGGSCSRPGCRRPTTTNATSAPTPTMIAVQTLRRRPKMWFA